MKTIKYIVLPFLLLILVGCDNPPTTIPLGSSVSAWGNIITVLDAQRYERSYPCGDYECYEDFVMVLIEWRCDENGQTDLCTLGDYQFTLKDGLTNKTYNNTFTYNYEHLFSIHRGGRNCCGRAHEGDVSKNYFIFSTGCGSDYQLRYNSEGKGVYYFNLPSLVDCNRET